MGPTDEPNNGDDNKWQKRIINIYIPAEKKNASPSIPHQLREPVRCRILSCVYQYQNRIHCAVHTVFAKSFRTRRTEWFENMNSSSKETFFDGCSVEILYRLAKSFA